MTLKIYEFEEKDHEFVDGNQLFYFRMFFEIVVMTLLMKMVIAILIGGYEAIHEAQEHANEHITTVPEDITELAINFVEWMSHEFSFLRHMVDGYVPPLHLDKLLRCKEVRAECPRYIEWSELLQFLNDRFPEIEYNFVHVEWILRRYGSDIPIDDPDRHGPRPLSGAALAKLEETFNSFDNEKDGLMSVDELRQAMEVMGYPALTRTQIRKKLSQIDRAHAGDIDLDEFCILVSGCHLDGRRYCIVPLLILNCTCRGEHHNTPTGSPTGSPSLSPHDNQRLASLRGSKEEVCDAKSVRIPTQMKGYGATSQSKPMDQLNL